MPFEPADEHYIRPVKVLVSSDSASVVRTGNLGEYAYRVQLPETLDYVIGAELAGYNFPNSMAPSFLPATTKQAGNNTVDFTLSDGITTTAFVATWPTNSYVYENTLSTWRSYVDVLPSLLTSAIAADATFGGNVTFACSVDVQERTVLTVEALAPAFAASDDVSLTFNFLTGPNVRNTAATQMGFPLGADAASASDGTVHSITSAGATSLRPFRYVDVRVDQFKEHVPFERVYFENSLYDGTVANADTDSVRILQQPTRYLRHMDIRLELADGRAPIVSGNPHDLVFILYVLSREIAVPDYAKQRFVLRA